VLPHSRAFAIYAGSLAGGADVLAGEPARNHVNTAAPRSSVKGLHVIPYRESLKRAVVLSGQQYAGCIGLPFNGAHCSPSEQLAAKYSATSACEKSQLIHVVLVPSFNNTHNTLFNRTPDGAG
jgi:hypothetical protein